MIDVGFDVLFAEIDEVDASVHFWYFVEILEYNMSNRLI